MGNNRLIVAMALAVGLELATSVQAFTFTDLYDFDAKDGALPKTSVVMDAAGMLWGTTNRGGSADGGTVYSFNPYSGSLTTVHSFTGPPDGTGPEGGMVLNNDGLIYGSTHGGGAHDLGTLFVIDPTTGGYTTLYSFSGPDGALPQAGLSTDVNGVLYGTTYQGGSTWTTGATGLGTVFRFDPKSLTETVLYSFLGPEGSNPRGNLALDASGTIYSTAQTGGASNLGVIWKLDTSGTLTTLHSYSGADGSDPASNGVVIGPTGMLYSATRIGAGTGCQLAGCGSVVSFDQTTAIFSVIHAFAGPDGAGPLGSIIFATDPGIVYGTTFNGGKHNYGTIFQINLGTSALTTMHFFAGTDGSVAHSPLLYDPTTNLLYGTTHSGGAHGFGTLFSISLTDGPFTLNPASLDFGYVARNTNSIAQSVQITNVTATTMPIAVALSGASPTSYNISTSCGPSLSVGGSCLVSVVFVPTTNGTKTANLDFTSGPGTETQTVALRGVGATTQFTVAPTSIAFPDQPHGSSSAPSTVILSNTGLVALPITSIALAGGTPTQFSVTSLCPTLVPVATSCTISVVFNPRTIGTKTTTLIVKVGGGAPRQTVGLTGNGI
jgi:uncharacterized repeat protein (TIGR03803 family)